MMPSIKTIHGQAMVAAPTYCSPPGASSAIAMVSSSTKSASSSPSAAWTANLWRLIVSLLSTATALLPFGGAWAASVWGSPVSEIYLLSHHRTQPQHHSQPVVQHSLPSGARDISEFNCFNANTPNVTIYATGGTIAGSANSADQTTGYQAGALGIQALIDAVPQLCNVANVRGVQFVNTDSINMNATVLMALSHQIQDDLDSPYTQGVVVTHGTDTLEESAFFLDLTVHSDKPVVMTGSMRPATAISADGPMNLLSSVTLAGSDSARGRGVMTVLNDRIGSARFTTKVNANQLDAFQAPDSGMLGTFVNVQPVFFYPPSRPLGHRHFDLRGTPGRWSRPGQGCGHNNINRTLGTPSGDYGRRHERQRTLPQVDVLYAHQELSVGLFQAAIDLGARGIILAGLGAGFWTSDGTQEIRRVLRETDIPVIVSRRPEGGFVGRSDAGIGAGFLNPQKARIQLQLALETGMDKVAIRELFEHAGVR